MSWFQQMLEELGLRPDQVESVTFDRGPRTLNEDDYDDFAQAIRKRANTLPARKRGGMRALREEVLYGTHRLKYSIARKEVKWIMRQGKKYGVDPVEIMAMILKDVTGE